jgi:hypothetical protein
MFNSSMLIEFAEKIPLSGNFIDIFLRSSFFKLKEFSFYILRQIDKNN